MQTFMLTCTRRGAARQNADRSRRSSPAFRQAALPGLGFVPRQQMPAHRSGTIPHCCRRRFRSHGRPTHLWGKVHLVSTGVCRWDSARRLRCCWRCAIHTCMRVSTLARPTATHATSLLRETPRLCAQETHANPERGKRQERAQHLLVQLLLRKPCSLLDEPPIEPASAPLVILVAPPLKGPKEIQEAP